MYVSKTQIQQSLSEVNHVDSVSVVIGTSIVPMRVRMNSVYRPRADTRVFCLMHSLIADALF